MVGHSTGLLFCTHRRPIVRALRLTDSRRHGTVCALAPDTRTPYVESMGMARRLRVCIGLLASTVALDSGCAGRIREYGGVEVQQTADLHALDPARVLKKRAGAIAIVETELGRGMGFVVDPSGYILTNRHVIEDADHIEQVVLPSTDPPLRFASVRLEYIDPHRDLALLKVEPARPLDVVPLAAGRPMDVHEYLAKADDVVLLARAGAMDPKLRKTGIRGLDATLGRIRNLEVHNRAAGPGPFVGITTEIRQGQSGGPVLDRFGRAVGIVTWTWRDRPGGYAIPISEATRMLAERPLLEDSYAQVRRAQIRTHGFLAALARDDLETVRRMTSPTYARKLREQTVGRLADVLGTEVPEPAKMFVAALEDVASDPSLEAFSALQDLAWRTGSREFMAALGVEDLERAQVVTFFFEFGKAYIAARQMSAQSVGDSLNTAIGHLRSLDTARTFALAELIPRISEGKVHVDRIEVVPATYQPRAVAMLSKRGQDGKVHKLLVHLRLEWGDWYVAEIREQA